MKETTYREALSHSWQLVWNHKTIWILGLLSLFVGQFGLSNFLGRLILWKGNITFFAWMAYFPNLFKNITSKEALLFGWIIFLALVLAAALISVAVFAQGTLIAIALDWFKKKSFNLDKSWHKGVKHFWRLFFLIFAEKYLLTILFILLILSLSVIPVQSVGDILFAVFILAAGSFLALIISVIAIYSKAYIIQEELPLFSSIACGAKLFREHFLVSFELSVLLLLLNFFLIILAIIGSFASLIPAVIFTIIGGFTGLTALISAGAFISWLVFIIFIIGCGAIFNTFTIGAWVYLFQTMHHEGLSSRVLRFVNGLFYKRPRFKRKH